jgi:putative addiction module antidote
MAATAKVLTIGSSSGIVLSKEVMARLKVKKGDLLYISDTPNGGVELTPYDKEFAEEMKALEYVMDKHRDVLRMLAE